MHKTSFKKSLLVAALSLTMANMATAANVPADANLAKNRNWSGTSVLIRQR